MTNNAEARKSVRLTLCFAFFELFAGNIQFEIFWLILVFGGEYIWGEVGAFKLQLIFVLSALARLEKNFTHDSTMCDVSYGL